MTGGAGRPGRSAAAGCPPCPACGGRTAPWVSAPAADLGVADAPDVPLARCAACGTAVTLGGVAAGIASGGDLHETGDYAPATPRGAGLAAPLLACFDRHRLAFVRRVVPPPAVLVDAGAGRGRFVAHARAAGYAGATGIEPTRRGVEAAAERHDLALQRASIEAAQVAAGSADVVTLWHVLEHVEDPGATLAILRDWLRPGGLLLVGTPNLDSWQARLAGPRWFHLDLPRHRTHFTARGLTRLLDAQGFEVVRVVHVLAEHNPYGMWEAGVSRMTSRPNYLYHLLKRTAPFRARDGAATVLGLALLPVAVSAELAAGLCRRGGTVAVVARRRS